MLCRSNASNYLLEDCAKCLDHAVTIDRGCGEGWLADRIQVGIELRLGERAGEIALVVLEDKRNIARVETEPGQ